MAGVGCQKAAGVVLGKLAHVEVLKRHILIIGKGVFEQRGLARLARSGERDNRILCGQVDELVL